ncbi:hypothetical protein M3667_14205 [Microbacterium sp. P26]|uniref:hypothetical protein n=1 Tax=Microbacterium TaxID=33882 RepID=UPI002041DE70|nr:hypothetical protein [Microbacterium sp. P26]MCM3503021.1 hypothetical protein [Microbacterium sp. P26]
MAIKRGRPAVIQDGVYVKTFIPANVDDAINSLVATSGGVSKSTLLRQALLLGLHALDVIPAQAVASIPTIPYERKTQ